MKKSQVRDLLYAGLGEVVTPTGFLLKKNDAFVRPISGGLNRIYVPLWDYNPVFRFSLTAGIRIDAVEQLFHLCSGAPTAYQKMSSTTLTQLSYFTEPDEFELTTPAEITVAVDHLAAIITGKVLPFFDRYSDVTALDQALNGGADPDLESTQLSSRALHWVAIAHLAGNPRVEQIAARFAQEMRTFPESEQAKLECLLAELRCVPARRGSH
jgi:hypothetical protein